MQTPSPRFTAQLLIGLLSIGGLGCQTSLDGNTPTLPGGDTSQRPTPEPSNPGSPPARPPEITINPTGEYTHFVLTNRQRFIGLPAWIPGVDYNSLAFTILDAPKHGALYGGPPNLVYVPNAGFSGNDSFIYMATGGGRSLQRRVKLQVAPTFNSPIGIPPPSFGIEESHHMYDAATYDFGNGPEPYKNAGNGPYTHFVDCNSGRDVNPDFSANVFGTAENPRQSIPTTLPAGSVVELHGSGFTLQSLQNVAGAGTSSQPIFIRGANPLQKATVRRPINIQTNYLILENIDFDYTDYGSPALGGAVLVRVNEKKTPLTLYHHIAVRHCLFRDMPKDPTEGALAVDFAVLNGAGSPNDATSLLENLVVYDIEVRNFGEWNNPSGSIDYAGCHFGANTRNVWLLDSHIHHVGSHAVGLSRTNALSDQAPCRNGYVARNYFHHCKESVVNVKHARDSVLSQNIMHTARDSDSGPGDGVAINANDATTTWPASDNIWVLFNEIYDTERGVDHTNADAMPIGTFSRSYIVGNVIHDTRKMLGNINTRGAGISAGQLTQSRIINNTIYNCDHGIWLGLPILAEPDRCTSVVRNNLIANVSENYLGASGQEGMHLYVRPSEIIPFMTVDHNLHWEDVGNVRCNIVAPGNTTRNYFLISQMFSETGLGGVSLQSPPMLTDPADTSFFLTNASPGVGTGLLDTAFTNFQLNFGRSILFYQDGSPMNPLSVNIGALPVK